MGGLHELMRDYERARYPEDRRLDVHGEGPAVARERALQWIQSRAHEEPGQDLLLIVARVTQPGRPAGPVEVEVRKLLASLEGKLIEWWQPFAPGSLAVRVSAEPDVRGARPGGAQRTEGEGRTRDTAGSARPLPAADIPAELLAAATRVAELRIEREGLSLRILDVVLREVWIETQALAMEHRIPFEAALERVREEELGRVFAD